MCITNLNNSTLTQKETVFIVLQSQGLRSGDYGGHDHPVTK